MTMREILNKKIAKGEKALIAYITGGDPDFASCEKFVQSLVKSGVDIIELGIPFSDPIGDGPIIQKAMTRALKSGASLSRVLDFVSNLRDKGVTIPIVLFSYYNPIFKMGEKEFAARAKKAGAQGVLVVDLPFEEGASLQKSLAENDLESVYLASPTTSKTRLKTVSDRSSGFVYYISRLGVTGVQSQLSQTLDQEIRHIHKTVTKPLAVGFGISTPEQAYKVAAGADAIVVGSAFVDIIEKNSASAAAEKLYALARSLREAIDRR